MFRFTKKKSLDNRAHGGWGDIIISTTHRTYRPGAASSIRYYRLAVVVFGLIILIIGLNGVFK